MEALAADALPEALTRAALLVDAFADGFTDTLEDEGFDIFLGEFFSDSLDGDFFEGVFGIVLWR